MFIAHHKMAKAFEASGQNELSRHELANTSAPERQNDLSYRPTWKLTVKSVHPWAEEAMSRSTVAMSECLTQKWGDQKASKMFESG